MRTKKSAKVNQFKKLAEGYCKGESFGVQDLLNATEKCSSLGLEDVAVGRDNIRSLMYAYGYLWLQKHLGVLPNPSTILLKALYPIIQLY